MKVAKTRHMSQRMGQRGITQEMLDIVTRYGVPINDKTILSKKGVDGILQQLDRLKKGLLKVRDKGGLVVVEAGEAQITAYRFGSFDRRKVG